jgi:hypothetical protein
MSQKDQIVAYLKTQGWTDDTWLPGAFYTVCAVLVQPRLFPIGSTPRAPERHQCSILVFDEDDIQLFIKNPDTLSHIFKSNSSRDIYTLVLLTPSVIMAYGPETLAFFREVSKHQAIYCAECLNITERHAYRFWEGAGLYIATYDIFNQTGGFSPKGEVLRQKHTPLLYANFKHDLVTVNDVLILKLVRKEQERTKTRESWTAGGRINWNEEELFTDETIFGTRSTNFNEWMRQTTFTGGFWGDTESATHSSARQQQEQTREQMSEAQKKTQQEFADFMRRMFEDMMRGQQQSVPKPPPTPSPSGSKTDWLHWLNQFNACRTYDDAQKIFRTAMTEHHPDAGGDAEISKAVTRAWASYKKSNKRK